MNARRLLSLVLVLLAAAPVLPAQDDVVLELEARYRRKMEKEFVRRVPWELRFDEALRKAEAEDKLVVAWFTRSYEPCPPCDLYEDGPLLSDWWAELAKTFIPYLNVSARLDDKPDQGLLIQKGGRAFPYCVILDSEGERLAELRPVSRPAVEQGFEEARLRLRLRRATEDPKDEAARAGLELFRAIRGEINLDIDSMKTLAATEGLDPEVRARFKDYQAELQVQKAFERVQERVRSTRPRPDAEAQRRMLETELFALLKEGVSFRVESNPAMFVNYAIFATRGALAERDLALARRGREMIARAESAFVPEVPVTEINRERGDEGKTERDVFRERVGLADIDRLIAELSDGD